MVDFAISLCSYVVMSAQNSATKGAHLGPSWSPWTPARIDALKAHWAKGLNARQIARELGHGICRASVLGKICRLGLAEPSETVPVPRAAKQSGHGSVAAKRAPEEASHSSVAATRARPTNVVSLWRPRVVPGWVLAARPHVDDAGVDAAISRAQRRTFRQLNARSCRWPVGDPSDPGFFFCGAERAAGKPFCAAHCERAYRHEEKGEGT